jgi:hypothetical protein
MTRSEGRAALIARRSMLPSLPLPHGPDSSDFRAASRDAVSFSSEVTSSAVAASFSAKQAGEGR